jgi:hypothetical protein
VSAIAGYVLGFVMVRYREIFFAMLSLALSMILYGILVRSAALGSTDGFNLPQPSFFGFAVNGPAGRLLVYALTVVMATGTAMMLHRFVNSPAGVIGEAILTNEIRVEYLGTSVTGVLHLTYVIGATTAGLGGALIAIAAGHIDPLTQLQSTRHAGRDGSEAPMHTLAHRLQRLEPIGRTCGMNADDFRIGVFHGNEDMGAAFPNGDRLRHVRSPHFIDLVGDDRPIVRLGLGASNTMRCEQAVLAHHPSHPAGAGANASKAQPRP